MAKKTLPSLDEFALTKVPKKQPTQTPLPQPEPAHLSTQRSHSPKEDTSQPERKRMSYNADPEHYRALTLLKLDTGKSYQALLDEAVELLRAKHNY